MSGLVTASLLSVTGRRLRAAGTHRRAGRRGDSTPVLLDDRAQNGVGLDQFDLSGKKLFRVVNCARVRLLADDFRRRHTVDIHSRGRLIILRHPGRDDNRAQHDYTDEGEKLPLVAVEQPQIVRKGEGRGFGIRCVGLRLINDGALDKRLRTGGGIRRRKGKDSFLIKHYDSRGFTDERPEFCKAHAPRVPMGGRRSEQECTTSYLSFGGIVKTFRQFIKNLRYL